MHGSYYKLVVIITLKHPQAAHDVVLRTTRTLPFQPYEGMTLVITNDDGDEYELTLGPPRYEFAESAFVEYQVDESLVDQYRDGEFNAGSVTTSLAYYKTLGFEHVKPKQVVNQAVTS
jgi:hypothetical protein